MIALPLITERPIDVLDLTAFHTTAEWEAALAAKYGDDWRDEPTDRDLALGELAA